MVHNTGYYEQPETYMTIDAGSLAITKPRFDTDVTWVCPSLENLRHQPTSAKNNNSKKKSRCLQIQHLLKHFHSLSSGDLRTTFQEF